MQLHSLVVSEPVGMLSGFGVGLITYHAASLCGVQQHTSLVLGCVTHFATNTVVAGHVNLYLLDFLALAIRLPAAAGSAAWMGHYLTSGRFF